MIIELNDQTKLEIEKVENDDGVLEDSYTIVQEWGLGVDVVILDTKAVRKLVNEITQDFLRKGI